MGDGELKSAVVDAGPIIHLNEIGCLTYLRIFSSLHVPDAVWGETVGHGHLSPQELNGFENLRRYTLVHAEVEGFIKHNKCEDLDSGERECLYLCDEIGVPLILTDDLAVRDVATRLNIIPVGSLGIVIKTYRSGKISLQEAESKLNDLYDVSSLFVTKDIVEMAIEHLHKKLPKGR